MRWCLLIVLLRAGLAHRHAVVGGAVNSSVLLQRAARQLASDGVNVLRAPEEDPGVSLDHDGFLSPGKPGKVSSWSHISRQGEALIAIPEPGTVTNRAISFITLRDSFFDTNLGASSLWVNRATLPHEWIVLDNPQNLGISALYASAQGTARNDLLVFLHPDVLLPESWYPAFMEKLASLETMDSNWGVLGTAGVPLGWTPRAPDSLKIASNITDCFSSYKSGIDNLPVQSLDEHLLVLRRSGSPKFDANLPGFDLYGTDIVLSARHAGMKAYLLNVALLHKLYDEVGQPYSNRTWFNKTADPSFKIRALTSQVFVQRKWCGSALLPSYGTFFDVLPCSV